VSRSDVLIIGAGPFGLSISAHLRELRVDHVIVGRPMDTWRVHVPLGMNLKSEAYGSDMASPKAGLDVKAYCRSHGLDHVERGKPLSLERFLGYADWYIKQSVPDVTDLTVADINAVDGGFHVAFVDAEPMVVRQIVIATGVIPHFYIPAELSGTPSELVSHTADHHRLDQFRGRRVAVVGAGQSAQETAALLHEAGADTQLILRRPALSWHPVPIPLTPVRRLRLPPTKLCEGWKCVFWNSPSAFRLLPQEIRISKAKTVLGPCGAWWLRDRIEGVIDVLGGHQVRGAEPNGSGVRLLLDGPSRSTAEVDHVIVGTGFRMDVNRLSFLPEGLKKRIATTGGYPVVNRAGESTVSGLYFAGALTAASLGPSTRFIAGTHNTASQLAQSVAHRVKANISYTTAPMPSNQIKHSKEDTTFQETF